MKRHAGRRRQENTQEKNYNRTSRVSTQQTEQPNAHQKAWNRSLQQKPQIARMNLFSEQIKGSGNQAQYAGEQESRSDGFTGCQPDEKQQRWNRETPATDPCQSHRQRNDEADEIVHHCPVSENVWIPHSSFFRPSVPNADYSDRLESRCKARNRCSNILGRTAANS